MQKAPAGAGASARERIAVANNPGSRCAAATAARGSPPNRDPRADRPGDRRDAGARPTSRACSGALIPAGRVGMTGAAGPHNLNAIAARGMGAMRLNPYLTFDGKCEAAFRFYEQALGGKIVAMMTFADTPMATQ